MKCPDCKADTHIYETQTNDYASHKPPAAYNDIIVIRRRRVCLLDKAHKFWTVEFPEEFWNNIIEKVITLS